MNGSILALSDGRAGNVAMAEGLAEAVAARAGTGWSRFDLDVPALVRRTPPGLWARLPASVVLGLAPRMAEATPRLIIGAGRRVAPFVEAMKRAHGIAAVQMLDCGLSPARFDHVVTPAHDGLSGAGVISTLGSLNGVTAERLSTARDTWAEVFAPLSMPRVAVLIGGTTKRRPLHAANVARFASALAGLAGQGASLMVTASRRTGPEAMAVLREALPGAWIWDGEGPNPYFGMLGWADALIVTDDSVNMASEAASTPAPVAIYPLLEETGKLARFHGTLYEAGVAEPFAGRLPVRDTPPLDETARVAALLAPLAHG